MSEETGFCAFYRKLEATVGEEDVFRLFNRGEFFSVYGRSAISLADSFFNSKDTLKYLGSTMSPLESTYISKTKFNAAITHILTVLKKPVHIYARPKGASKDSLDWSVSKKASAGDVSAFGDLVTLDGAATTMLVYIAATPTTDDDSARTCTVATVDTMSASVCGGVFIDNNSYSSLQTCIAQLAPSDCYVVLASDLADNTDATVAEILRQCDVNMTRVSVGQLCSGDDVVTPLLSAETQNTYALFKQDTRADVAAVVTTLLLKLCLLPVSAVTQKVASYKAVSTQVLTFSLIDLDKYMRLDQAALVALNILPAASDSDKSMSVLGLLNKTRTAMGGRKLQEWLRLPLLNKAEIEARHDVVECFALNQSALGAFRDALKGTGDVDRLCKKLCKKSASGEYTGTLQDIVALYQMVLKLPILVSALGELDSSSVGFHLVNTQFLGPLKQFKTDLGNFESLVEQTVDVDSLSRHEYLVNPNFNEELTELYTKKNKLKRAMDRVLADVASDLGLDDKKVKLDHSNHLGYHFRVSRKDEKNLRESKQVTTIETRKDGVKFTTSHLKKLSEEYKEVMVMYNELQSIVVDKALEVTSTYLPLLESISALTSELDVLTSFAHVSVSSFPAYVRPVMHERVKMGGTTHKFELIASRHPCLEVQPGVSFISNDIVLVKGESNVQIITGPNMGGKSTYIRSAGVIAVMAQIGCFVPCERAELSIVDAVLARVGAGDSQLKGVSTFMKEMLEAAAILKAATADSLVIIDELGRGTSTYDGFGLAWAIAEHIATHVDAFALFATHFHELTAISDVMHNVVNKHVTAHTSTGAITMLYKLKQGACDKSFGIHVSELANFPAEVVAKAREKAKELERFGNEASSVINRDESQDSKRQKTEVKLNEDDMNVFLSNVFNNDTLHFDAASDDLNEVNVSDQVSSSMQKLYEQGANMMGL